MTSRPRRTAPGSAPTARSPADLAFARFRATGDAAAAGELFDATSDDLFRVALTLAPDAAAAEDALQETYLAALRQAADFDPKRPVRPWLLGILRRQVGRGRRRAARSPDPSRLVERSTPLEPLDELVTDEDRARVRAAIDSLDEPYRSVALLRWCYGMEPAEIAHVRDQAPGTVRSLLHRAVRRLRPLLSGLAVVVAADAVALGSVRAQVLAEAARLGPVTSSPVTPTSILTGGLLMSATAKSLTVVVVAVLLLVAAGVGVTLLDGSAPTTPAVAESATGTLRADQPSEEPRPRTARAPETTAVAPPATVDLAAIDRERDLHGRVVDERGAVVPGARVRAVLRPWKRANLFHADDVVVSGPETTTDSAGSFALRLEPGEVVDLEVEAAGHVGGRMPRCQAGERVEVELRPARLEELRWVVRTVDAEGAPIVGARVSALCEVGGATAEGRTDASGRVELALDADRRHVRVTAEADGYAREAARGIEPRATSQTLELSPTAGLAGRVTDARSGEPIKGASVGTGWRLRDATTTDDDGRFELPHWSEASYAHLVVAAPGYAPETRTVGARREIDFALLAGRTAVGRVVDGEGRPVGGARVAALGERTTLEGDMLSLGHALSGADGRFVLPGLRPDTEHTLVVVADGFGRTLRVTPAGAAPLELGDVVLAPARTVAGRVVDGAGEPLARVRVRLVGPFGAEIGARPPIDTGRIVLGTTTRNTLGREEERFTDDLGRFRFPELAPGEYRLRALPDGAPSVDHELVVGGEDVADVELCSATDRVVEIRVAGPGGEPQAGVWCMVRSGQLPSVRTDEQGRAELRVPGGASFELRLQHPREAELGWLAPEPVGIGGAQTLVELRFREGFALAGRVVDADGAPVPGFELSLRRGGVELTTVTADREGAFRHVLPDAAPVDVVLTGRAMRQEGRMWSVIGVPYTGRAGGAVPGGEPIDVVAEPLPFDGALVVRVLSPEGEPVPGAGVWLVEPRVESVAGVQTDEEGRAELTGLPRGQVVVFAHFAGRTPPDDWMNPERLAAESDGSTHELRFRQGHPVTGVVREADGAPVAQTVVRVLRGESYVGAAATDADGRFRVLVPADDGPAFTLIATVNDARGIVEARAEDVRAGQDLVLVVRDP